MNTIKQRKREAAEFLGRKGRRIEIIFFGLLLVFVTFVPIYIYYCTEELFAALVNYICNTAKLTAEVRGYIDIGATCLTVLIISLFAIFVSFPAYAQFFSYSYKVYRDSVAGAPKYFSFGKGGYGRAIVSGFFIALAFALCLAPVIAIFNVGLYVISLTEEKIKILSMILNYAFPIFIVIGLLIGFFVFLLFYPFFLFPYYVAREKNAFRAIGLSVRQMRKKSAKKLYWRYIGGFLPSIILSLITILVLFLIDTMPKMSMVYFDVAEDIVAAEK